MLESADDLAGSHVGVVQVLTIPVGGWYDSLSQNHSKFPLSSFWHAENFAVQSYTSITHGCRSYHVDSNSHVALPLSPAPIIF